MNVAGVNRDEVIAGMRQDLNILAQVCTPEVYKFAFPPMHLAVWHLLTKDANNIAGLIRLALGLPRGFAKTMLLKLFVVWLILFTDRRFVIVVCNIASLAENFIADVETIMESPNIRALFGDWKLAMVQDRQEQKKFTFCGRSISLAGLGSQGSLRGLNLQFVRPDVILMDDMQSREEAESHVESEKTLTWMLGTLMKARDPSRCLFAFIGNMYPFPGSILKKLKHNPAWVSLITGAILADGESIWPELRSVEDILDELENDTSMGHPEIFFSEVMNDEEAGNRAGIDITKINYWDDTTTIGGLPPEAEAGFILVDPSAGKKKSDNVAVGAFFIFSGVPVLWDLKLDKLNPKQQIEAALTFAMVYNITAIVVEGVAYQTTLAFWMNHFCTQRGLIGLKILEIYPGIMQKVARILAMLKSLVAERVQIALHPRVKNKVIYEIVHFNPLKQKNVDDAMDLLAYASQVIATHGNSLLRPFEHIGPAPKAAFSSDLELEF